MWRVCFSLLLVFFMGFDGLDAANCASFTDCGSCSNNNGFLGAHCCWDQTMNACTEGVLSVCLNGGTGLPFNCPENPPSGFVYDDNFGRHRALPFIAAAFGTTVQESQTCLDNKANGAQVIAKYDFPNCPRGAVCHATLAVWDSMNAIIIAFPGADGLEQLILTGVNILTSKVKFAPGGQVYSLYNDGFNGLWNMGLGAKVAEVKNNNRQNFELWVFGHSLGAGIGSVGSTFIGFNNIFDKTKIKFLGTGQTRTGDLAYAQAHEANVPNSYRVVNVGDLITKLPPKVSVLGISILDDPSTFHHRFEVWYPTAMTVGSAFKICTEAEDSTCSASNLNLGQIDFHNNYYNVPINTWYQTGCV